jgi:germination protein M
MRRTLCALAAIGLLLAGNACGGRQTPAAMTSQNATATSTTPAAPGAGTGITARVYFVRADKVATAGRKVSGTDTKEQAIHGLLAGPDDFERNIGMSTEIPAGTELVSLNVADGTATVDLSNDFRSGGVAALPALPMQRRVAEVVFTLTQFDDVHKVTITLEGKPLEGAVNLKRGDLEALIPMILVESPVLGESVTSPLQVSGIANVFEGTVSYSVNAPDGAKLDQNFTTATGPEWGHWGTFTFTSAYTTQQHGLGRVVV